MQEQGLASGHGEGTGTRSEDVVVPEQHELATQTHDQPAPAMAGDGGAAEAVEAAPALTDVAGGAEASHSSAGQQDPQATSEHETFEEAGTNPDVQDAEETAAALSPTEFASPPSEEAAVHPVSEDWQVNQEQPDAPLGDDGGARVDAGILHAEEPDSGAAVITEPSRENTGITRPSETPRDDQAQDQAVRLYRAGTEATLPDAETLVDGHPQRVSQLGHYEAQQIVVPPHEETGAASGAVEVSEAEQPSIVAAPDAEVEQEATGPVTATVAEDHAPTAIHGADSVAPDQHDEAAPVSDVAVETPMASHDQAPPEARPTPRRPVAPSLRSLTDLSEGQVVTGRVKSLAAFGAFVDLGLRERKDGLIHVSQLADRRIGHPSEVVQVGQEVTVRVVTVDRTRGRIGLSLRDAEEAEPAPPSYRPAPVAPPVPVVEPPVHEEVTLQSLVDRYARPSGGSQLPPQRGSRRADRDRQERDELLRRLREESNQT